MSAPLDPEPGLRDEDGNLTISAVLNALLAVRERRAELLTLLWNFEAIDFGQKAGYTKRDQERLADAILQWIDADPECGNVTPKS